MSDNLNNNQASAAGASEHKPPSIDAEAAAALLKQGPRGALAVAGFSVGLLLIGWLLFYFLLFIPRGSIG
jgi:hypothetical protein